MYTYPVICFILMCIFEVRCIVDDFLPKQLCVYKPFVKTQLNVFNSERIQIETDTVIQLIGHSLHTQRTTASLLSYETNWHIVGAFPTCF